MPIFFQTFSPIYSSFISGAKSFALFSPANGVHRKAIVFLSPTRDLRQHRPLFLGLFPSLRVPSLTRHLRGASPPTCFLTTFSCTSSSVPSLPSTFDPFFLPSMYARVLIASPFLKPSWSSLEIGFRSPRICNTFFF